MRAPTLLLSLLTLANCAAPDAHIPPFARAPYEAFSRETLITIALREWRLFGEITEPADAEASTPERAPGLWQRVGEYWWLGLAQDAKEARYTGKHDATGQEFPTDQDGRHAWSAAFISYAMRIAGAGPNFAYSPNHWTYIDRAIRTGTPAALDPQQHAPIQGDLICHGRAQAAALRYTDLPAGPYPAHCDIVVARAQNHLAVIGGNVRDTVAMKHIPLGPDGTISDPERTWLVILRPSD